MERRQAILGCATLVICGILLAGLFLPLLYQDRIVSRRTICANNLRQLTFANASFETSTQRYPGCQEQFGVQGGSEQAKLGTWPVALLPYIEQQALRDLWDDPSEQQAWATAITQEDGEQLERFYPALSVLLCPEDNSQKPPHAPLSYVANTGFYLLPDDPAFALEVYQNAGSASERSTISQREANGMFSNLLPEVVWDPSLEQMVDTFGPAAEITGQDIRDGLSQTLALSENHHGLSWRNHSLADDSVRYQVGMVWLYAGDRAAEGRPPPSEVTADIRFGNGAPTSSPVLPTSARPSAAHPGVVNCSMADGSTVLMSREIDYHVYQALMSPQTRQSDMPDPMYNLRDRDFR